MIASLRQIFVIFALELTQNTHPFQFHLIKTDVKAFFSLLKNWLNSSAHCSFHPAAPPPYLWKPVVSLIPLHTSLEMLSSGWHSSFILTCSHHVRKLLLEYFQPSTVIIAALGVAAIQKAFAKSCIHAPWVWASNCAYVQFQGFTAGASMELVTRWGAAVVFPTVSFFPITQPLV